MLKLYEYDYHVDGHDRSGLARQNFSLFVELLKHVLYLVYFKYACDVYVAQLLL